MKKGSWPQWLGELTARTLLDFSGDLESLPAAKSSSTGFNCISSESATLQL